MRTIKYSGIQSVTYYPDTDSFRLKLQEADEFVSTDEVAPGLIAT